jgi:DegV family protein with EDD domain
VSSERIGVVTDSLAWLPASVTQSHGIRVVPLHVRIDDQEFTEGVDLSNEEFFRRLPTARALPKTSQPSAGEFLAAYQEVAERAGAILSVHASSRLSGTYRAAETGAAMLREARPGVRVVTLDTMTAASAEGIVAVRAAEDAAAGVPFDEVVVRARALAQKTRLLFVLETMEYLQKGGRIGRAQAFLGGLLHIRPILTVDEGEVTPKDRARTRGRAMERVLELMAEDAQGRPFRHVGVLHAAAPESAAELKRLIQERFGVPEGVFMVVEIGPVIGTYTGPDAFGVSYYCE